MTSSKSALIIGNSDGIGLGLTRRLLDLGWQVTGLSRSPSSLRHDRLRHIVVNVTSPQLMETLLSETKTGVDLCVFCAGIGEELETDAMAREREVFDVNLMGAVKTMEVVLPSMLRRGSGHIIVLSSLADQLVSKDAPSYAASKAALSSYTEGLALAVRDRGISITNVRFGFVDTKMAKGGPMPFKMTVDRAVDHLVYCIEKRPIRYSRPRLMALLVRLVRLLTWFKL